MIRQKTMIRLPTLPQVTMATMTITRARITSTAVRQDILLLHTFRNAIGQTHQTLHLAGDDDLGGLAVGDALHGLDGFQLDHLVVGSLLVQQFQRVGQSLLDGQNRLSLTVGP